MSPYRTASVPPSATVDAYVTTERQRRWQGQEARHSFMGFETAHEVEERRLAEEAKRLHASLSRWQRAVAWVRLLRGTPPACETFCLACVGAKIGRQTDDRH